MSWRAAPSVAWALKEADTRWPKRNKASDGIIGDADHSSRYSDHNPDDRGIVHAYDLTHDIVHSVNCRELSELLRLNRDPRIKYVISERKIFYGPHSTNVKSGKVSAWRWYPFSGINPHTSHMHVSIGYTKQAENDIRPWFESVKEPEVSKMIFGTVVEERENPDNKWYWASPPWRIPNTDAIRQLYAAKLIANPEAVKNNNYSDYVLSKFILDRATYK